MNIHIGGGIADCPEMSLGGLKAGIEKALPNSLIFVITDATAKDHDLFDDVEKRIQNKQHSANFILTDDCDARETQGFKVYNTLARRSNSLVYDIKKNGIEKVLMALQPSMKDTYSSIKLDKKSSAGKSTTSLYVDSTMSNIDVKLCGQSPKLIIRNPLNEIVTGDVLSMDNLNIVNIKNPMAGKWTVESDSSSGYTVQMGSNSELKIKYGFSCGTPKNHGETSVQPLSGKKTMLSFFISDPSKIGYLSNATLLLEKDEDVADKSTRSKRETKIHYIRIKLTKIGPDTYTSEAFEAPEGKFKVQLNGVDSNGNDIERLVSTAIESVEPIIVFDGTRSMEPDLEQLRIAVEKIVNEFSNFRRNPIFNYVLSVFRDPDNDRVVRASSPEEFLENLDNIEFTGGGDCPEMSLGGLQAGIQYGLPKSIVYVITDATAKDDNKYIETVRKLVHKKSTVNFLLTGDCGKRNSDGYFAYKNIARHGNGQVFHIDTDGIEKVLMALRITMKDSYTLNQNGRTVLPGTSFMPFSVDSTITDISIRLCGEGPKLTIKNPLNQIVTGDVLTLENLQIVSFKNPMVGKWTIDADSSSEYTIQIESNIIVFDGTLSMEYDLEQLKIAVEKIVNEFSNFRRNPIFNYVLSVFRDPVNDQVVRASSPEKFLENLNNIEFTGGGDCPEMSLGGLQAGIQYGLPKSIVYVITDATAKDENKYNKTVKNLIHKKSTVNFLLTDDCGKRNSDGYKAYKDIARLSNGQVFHIDTDGIEKVLMALRITMKDSYTLNQNGRTVLPGTSFMPFSVDSTITDISIRLCVSNLDQLKTDKYVCKAENYEGTDERVIEGGNLIEPEYKEYDENEETTTPLYDEIDDTDGEETDREDT
ncbi:unnamed protein product [Diamesa tonsa]